MQRQPRSGLATVKRDFSSNSTTDTSLPSEPPAAATKRSALSDSLRKAIQDGVASREADKTSLSSSSSQTASQKRPLSPGTVPSSNKRQLPSSWSNLDSSSATFSRGSSQSVYFQSRSSMSSALPLDMLSQVDPEFASTLPSEPKAAQRPAAISLSDEQKYILELVMRGKNIFYTGSAGVSDSPWPLHTVCQSYHLSVFCVIVEDRQLLGCLS
jgi:ATP-dependent DNA helicase PIF1